MKPADIIETKGLETHRLEEQPEVVSRRVCELPKENEKLKRYISTLLELLAKELNNEL